MANRFVKLPHGNVEINHIRKMVSEIKLSDFQYSNWLPRPALRDKKSGLITHLFVGQKFDETYFDLDNNGWTHDHCLICFNAIGADSNDYIYTDGYNSGSDWVCKSCYDELVLADDLEKKIEAYGTYEE